MFINKVIECLKYKVINTPSKEALIEYLINTNRLFYNEELSLFFVKEEDNKLHVGWYI